MFPMCQSVTTLGPRDSKGNKAFSSPQEADSLVGEIDMHNGEQHGILPEANCLMDANSRR